MTQQNKPVVWRAIVQMVIVVCACPIYSLDHFRSMGLVAGMGVCHRKHPGFCRSAACLWRENILI